MRERLARLQELLEEPLLVTNPINVTYLCGLSSSNAALLVEPERVQLFTDFRYLERAETIASVEAVQTRRNLYADLAERLEGRIGFEPDAVTVARYHVLDQGGLELVPRRGLVEQLREVKDSAELAAVRRSAEILTEAMRSLAESWSWAAGARGLGVGLVERMHGSVRRTRRSRPSSPVVSRPLRRTQCRATAGSRWGRWSSSTQAPQGQRLLLGLHADVFDREAPGRARGGVRRGAEAQLAGLAAVRPGADGAAVDGVARKVIEDAGLGEAFRAPARSRRRPRGARGAVAQPRAREHARRRQRRHDRAGRLHLGARWHPDRGSRDRRRRRRRRAHRPHEGADDRRLDWRAVAEVVNTNQFRNGMHIEVDGDIWPSSSSST